MGVIIDDVQTTAIFYYRGPYGHGLYLFSSAKSIEGFFCSSSSSNQTCKMYETLISRSNWKKEGEEDERGGGI